LQSVYFLSLQLGKGAIMATTRSTAKARRASVDENTSVPDDMTDPKPVTKRLVLVGYKTLSAPLLVQDDVIRYGQTLELEGKALEWATNAVYTDQDGYECDVFAEEGSREAEEAVAIVKGERPRKQGSRRRPARRR
jgi:hypothetical protein